MRTTFLLITSIILSSCTILVWEDQFYNEKIAGFYVSKNENLLIGIGEKFNYFFKINDQLIGILTAEGRNKLKPSFEDFEFNSNNKIKGQLSLEINASKNINIHSYEKNGFVLINNKILKYDVSLMGKRSKTDSSLKNHITFNNPYIVKVTKSATFLGVLDKIVATPMAIIVDAGLAVLLVGGVIIGPIMDVLPKNDK